MANKKTKTTSRTYCGDSLGKKYGNGDWTKFNSSFERFLYSKQFNLYIDHGRYILSRQCLRFERCSSAERMAHSIE